MKDHILLVEDEQRIADFVCAGLAERGLEVHHCSDGNSGFAQATTGKFDVILLDLMLPGRDGLSVLKGLRDAGVPTPSASQSPASAMHWPMAIIAVMRSIPRQ